MPAEWKEASFLNLRTEGAFLITALRKNGQTNLFSAESLIGGECVMQSDIAVDSLQSTSKNKINKFSPFVFSVDMAKWEKVSFYSKGIKDFGIGSIAKSLKKNYWGTKK